MLLHRLAWARGVVIGDGLHLRADWLKMACAKRIPQFNYKIQNSKFSLEYGIMPGFAARPPPRILPLQVPFMSFFISDAMAQTAGTSAGPGMGDMVFFVAIIALFYFMLIRPQMKRQKEHKKLVTELAKGDEVVTNGGLLGKVTKIGEDFMDVQLAEGVVVKVQKAQVGAVVPKGTIKNA